MKLNPRTTAVILLFTYIALVFFCCLYRFSGSESMDLGQYFLGIRLDRCIHFTMFLPYPFVAWLFLSYSNTGKQYPNSANEPGSASRSKIKNKNICPILLLSGIILAVIAEASQEMLTNYRDTDPFDLVANFTGVAAGTLIVCAFNKPLKKITSCLFSKTQH